MKHRQEQAEKLTDELSSVLNYGPLMYYDLRLNLSTEATWTIK